MRNIEYETPKDFFATLDQEFNFTIDVCATPENTKCARYYTQQHDALDRDWSKEVVWMNPPYNGDIAKWIRKAYLESLKGATVVCLIQSRSTDSKMWHSYVMKASEWRFVADRLHFICNGKAARANISSVVVIFRPNSEGGAPKVCSIDTKGVRF